MSNLSMRHPDEGTLLRFIDGELPGRKARQIQRHLEACWRCRMETESLQGTVADCMHYRKTVLEPGLPEAPGPWMDLAREFDRIDSSLESEGFWKRFLPRAQSLRWSMAAATLLAAAVGLLYFFRETPSVHAATLLKRAVANAAQHPQAARQYRVRTRNLETVRSGGAAVLPGVVAARLDAAHFDSNNPFSARAFQAWRDSLAVETDEITKVTDPAGAESYRVRTMTPTGEVASATLTLRSTDLSPVDETLEFRDRDWIEFTELTEPTAVSDTPRVAKNVEVPVRPSVPSGTAAFTPRQTASISDELQVLSALHQIGADLGDPIEVRLSGGRVLVSGVGVPPQRQKQIHDMLDSLPNVSVDFANPAAVSSEAPAASGGAAATDTGRMAAGSKLQARLEQQLGGRAEFERFSSQVLDADEAAMARAYALRALAQRVPASEESRLSAAERRDLRAMATEHLAALEAQMGAIQRALTPVLNSLGGTSSGNPSTASAAEWQPAAEDLFRASRRVEVLLSVLLGVTPGQSPDSPSQLAGALSDVKADLAQCQRLLAQ